MTAAITRSKIPGVFSSISREPLGHHKKSVIDTVKNNKLFSLLNHHIVSATALIHRTARPSISAMSSLLGISPKCVQLVMIWFRSYVAAPHMYSVCSHGSPTDVSPPGCVIFFRGTHKVRDNFRSIFNNLFYGVMVEN